MCGVVLTGLNYTTHEDIVQKALDHFIEWSGDLDKCFVQERCGRIALLVSGQEDSEEVFDHALHSPYFSLDNNSLYVTPVAYDPKRFIKLQHVPVFLKGVADSSPPPYQSTGEIVLGEKDEQQVVLLREALKITDFFARLPLVCKVAACGDPVSASDNLVRVPPSSSSSSSSSSSPLLPAAPDYGAHVSAAAPSNNIVTSKERASFTNPPSPPASSSSSCASSSSTGLESVVDSALEDLVSMSEEISPDDEDRHELDTEVSTIVEKKKNKKKKKNLSKKTLTDTVEGNKKSKADEADNIGRGTRQRTLAPAKHTLQTDIRFHTTPQGKGKEGKRRTEVTSTNKVSSNSGQRDDG